MQKVTILPPRGIRGGLLLFIALCLHCAARGQTQYEYWFDNDRSTAVTSSSPTMEVDVSGLSESLHAIHIQAKGNGTKILGYYMMVDQEHSFEQYVVNTQIEEMLSAPVTRYFVKVPQQGVTVRCWIDDDFSTLRENVATGQTVMLDLEEVSDGFHYLTVQPLGQGGGVGTPRVYPFVKVHQMATDDQMTCYYTIDGHITSNMAGSLGNGTYHFDVDVSSLSDGLHRISFVLCNSKGVIANAETHFFIKIPVGGYGITQYWYWLNNDDGEGEIMKIPVNPSQNPFNLVQDLVLVEKPIRSTKFAFGFKDGQPAIFSKNDLHMRFFDVSGRFTDLIREYVDERVYWIVDHLPLPLNGNGSTDLSATNSMQWFVISLNEGNILHLQLDHPATIQVFDSNGNEVYSAEGQDAVSWEDIQANANGNYYVVVHDPTTYYTNVTLNYNIIGRLGDVDGNGRVTIADAIDVVNHLLGMTPEGFIEDAADVNRNGKITIADAVGIVNIILQDNQ